MQAISVRSLLWLLFIRDWPWKVLSFAIALLVYFSLRSEILNERNSGLATPREKLGQRLPSLTNTPSTPVTVPASPETATEPNQP